MLEITPIVIDPSGIPSIQCNKNYRKTTGKLSVIRGEIDNSVFRALLKMLICFGHLIKIDYIIVDFNAQIDNLLNINIKLFCEAT
jgi:hypothetical protein